MPQLKTQKDNLTESEKERFQNAYISELKKLYPVPLPKDGVILNVHSIYRSPYQGDIESYIEVYGDNHEKLMRLTNHAMGCTVQELEHSKQAYHLAFQNKDTMDKPFLYGVPLVLKRESLNKLKTIRISWKQTTENSASTIIQDIEISGKDLQSEGIELPVYDVAAENICLQDFPYWEGGEYTKLADAVMKELTNYHMFYTNPFPGTENKIIQFPLPMAKTVQAIQKIERGEAIKDIKKEMGLRFYQHPDNKTKYQSDEDIIKYLFYPHVRLKRYFEEIGKRYFRLIIMHMEMTLRPDDFPFESMLEL